jgi:hypothetical protein
VNPRRIGDRLVWVVRSNDLTHGATRAEDVTLFVHLLVPFTTTYKHITSIFIIWFNNSYFLVQIIQYKGRKEMIINYNYLSFPRIYRELSPSSINCSRWSTRREPLTMGKQLVNFITCGCESSAPFFVIYKAGREPTPHWW